MIPNILYLKTLRNQSVFSNIKNTQKAPFMKKVRAFLSDILDVIKDTPKPLCHKLFMDTVTLSFHFNYGEMNSH